MTRSALAAVSRAFARPGAARRRANRGRAVVTWLVGAGVLSWASAQANEPTVPRCGDAPGVGVLVAGALEDGALQASWTLVAAPAPALVARPLVFADGRLAADLGPVTFPCTRDVTRTVPVPGVRDAVHWTLHGWPPVPSALAALDFDQAARTYAARLPPGTFAMADVALARPADGRPWPTDGTARPDVPADGAGGGIGVVDDAVSVRGGDGEAVGARARPVLAAGGRLVRADVGMQVPLRLTYAAPDDGRVLATCLLDGAQVAAFDGAPTVAVQLRAGSLLVLDGSVRVARAGWQRLHCLLLPDDPDPAAPSPPRPLLALYLWGDRP